MAPQVSVVVPVYNVEGYLRRAVESIRGHVDHEIVLVDDASTDGSLALANELAASRDDIRVVALEQNAGLGNARNVGLDHALGEWVFFLDSDDELTNGTLDALVALGDRTSADVVMVDHARLYWDGVRARNRNARIFSKGSGPFTAVERPDLLDNLNVAWNKLYRRSFIDALDLRFPPGLYEDIPWTYPVLLAADRVALLDRVGVLYRQRREGSILRSPSPGHLDVIDQYERLFDWLDANPDHAWSRELLFAKMSSHLLTVYDFGERRIPGDLRATYYRRMSQIVARHAPDGVEAPGRAGGLRHRAVRSDNKVVDDASQALRSIERRVNEARRTTTDFLREQKARAGTASRLMAYRAARARPIDPDLVLFSSYWYRGANGNPRAVADAAADLAPHKRRVWMIRSDATHFVPDRDEHVVVGTPAYYRALATAAVVVDNSNLPDFVRPREGTTYLQTQHGTPLKHMGLDLQTATVAGRMNFEKLMERVDRWDHVLSSNAFSTEAWARAFPARFTTLEYGYPRNDVFYGDVATATKTAREALDIPAGARVVLYAPTFRDHQVEPELLLDLARLDQQLPDDVVVLVRSHSLDEDLNVDTSVLSPRILDVSRHPEMQELCLAADILVTDYSSVMFDYAHLGRPIVIHAPDWETYVNVRGVYFDLLAAPPGRVVTTQDELVDVLTGGGLDGADEQRSLDAFRARFCTFDDGRAAERVVHRFLLGENLPDRRRELEEYERNRS